MSGLYLRFAAWAQAYLAAAEERLRSARLEAVLAEHQAEVEAVVSQMREGGASEHDIAVLEAEQVVVEAKMETAKIEAKMEVRNSLCIGVSSRGPFVFVAAVTSRRY